MGPGGNGMSHVFLGGMFPVVRTHWTSLPSPLHEIIFSIGMDGMGFGGMGRMGGMWFISSAILFEYFCPVLIPSGKDLQLLLVWFTYCSSRVLISFGWSFFMLLCYKYSWHYNIVLLFSKLLLNLTTELTTIYILKVLHIFSKEFEIFEGFFFFYSDFIPYEFSYWAKNVNLRKMILYRLGIKLLNLVVF